MHAVDDTSRWYVANYNPKGINEHATTVSKPICVPTAISKPVHREAELLHDQQQLIHVYL